MTKRLLLMLLVIFLVGIRTLKGVYGLKGALVRVMKMLET